MIAMVLMMPKLFAEKGIVDQEEIRNLPALYKGMLVVPMAVNFFSVCCFDVFEVFWVSVRPLELL